MTAAITYREIAPSPALAGLVRCYWEIRSGEDLTQPIRNRVLPDGCADIIVNFGRPLLAADAEIRTPAEARLRPFVVGAMRAPSLFGLGGGVDIFGIRFGPGGARPFFGIPLAELTDLTVDLEDIWPRRSTAAAELLLRGAGMEERVAIAERILLDHLARIPADRHRIVTGATHVMDRKGGAVTIAEIERIVGVSRRQLERVFAEQVGVTPKLYCRVARLQRMLPLIDRCRSDVDWSDLVYRCGYYDQSHLIAETRALTGLTPTELHRERVAFFQSPHEPAR